MGLTPIRVYLSQLSLSSAFGFRQTPGNLLPMGERPRQALSREDGSTEFT
jgi:hypothetical protein